MYVNRRLVVLMVRYDYRINVNRKLVVLMVKYDFYLCCSIDLK